jgi:DNA-binding response OmpR family regulator
MISKKNINVLVVSKDEHLRGSIEMYLYSRGFEVTAVATFEAALEHMVRQHTNMIISEHGRSSVEALKFFSEIEKSATASYAYRIILCNPSAPKNECDGLEHYADLCIQMPLTKEAVDQFLLHVTKLWEKKAKT